MGVKMKISLLIFAFVFVANAEITTETEYLQAVNTPSPFNRCMGARLEKGHNASFQACIRTYFPSCQAKQTTLDVLSCVASSAPVNVTQKDIQRQKQIDEWKQKHH